MVYVGGTLNEVETGIKWKIWGIINISNTSNNCKNFKRCKPILQAVVWRTKVGVLPSRRNNVINNFVSLIKKNLLRGKRLTKSNNWEI